MKVKGLYVITIHIVGFSELPHFQPQPGSANYHKKDAEMNSKTFTSTDLA